MMSLLACWGQSLGRVKLLNPALQDDGFKRDEIPEKKKKDDMTRSINMYSVYCDEETIT